nr:DUF1206 domain-containing protein [uncultured Cohaesibacter sp.]
MTATQPRHWIEIAARAGYSARGTIYFILGLLIIAGGVRQAQSTDTRDAVDTLMMQPFGSVLVWLLFAGLCGYVLWRIIQVVLDPDDQWDSPRGYVIRAALAISALSYTFIALYCLSLLGVLFSGSDGDGGSGFRQTADSILGARYSALLLTVMFGGTAIAHWWKAFSGSYRKYFKADDNQMRMLRPIIIVGLSARGLVFAFISWLLASRFFYLSEHTTGENPGLQEVLSYLSGLPYGLWLVVGLGVGLMAFSLYSFSEARWRRVGQILD